MQGVLNYINVPSKRIWNVIIPLFFFFFSFHETSFGKHQLHKVKNRHQVKNQHFLRVFPFLFMSVISICSWIFLVLLFNVKPPNDYYFMNHLTKGSKKRTQSGCALKPGEWGEISLPHRQLMCFLIQQHHSGDSWSFASAMWHFTRFSGPRRIKIAKAKSLFYELPLATHTVLQLCSAGRKTCLSGMRPN